MLNIVSLIITFLAYSAASILLLKFIKRTGVAQSNQTAQDESLLKKAYSAGLIAVSAHIYFAFSVSQVDGILNFSFSSMKVLLSAIIVLIYLLGCLWMPIRRLGVLIYPITILTLMTAVLWNSDVNLLSNKGTAFIAHILVAILAYCLLTLAAVQALLYFYQEKQFKKRQNPSLLLALPPLQTMETLLFRLIGLGFLLLSLALVSGAIFSQQIFGHSFELNHHNTLATLGWVVFAYILIQRARNGLRGISAVALTLCGFTLIQLGYFGTKLIMESIA